MTKKIPNKLSNLSGQPNLIQKSPAISNFLDQFGGSLFLNTAFGKGSDLSVNDLAKMGAKYIEVKDYENALKCYLRAIAKNPKIPELHYVAALCYQDLNMHAKSKASLLEAIKLRNNYFEAITALSAANFEREVFEEVVITIEQHIFDKRLGLKNVYQFLDSLEYLGQFRKRERYLEKFLKIHPFDPALLHMWVKTFKPTPTHERFRKLAEIAHHMEVMPEDFPGTRLETLLNTLAVAYDKNGLVDEAFRYFQKANHEILRKNNYNIEADLKSMESVKKLFKRDVVKFRNAEFTPIRKNIIFIVGLPRSGSTVIEQTLASHTSVTALGEYYYITHEFQHLLKRTKSDPELLTVENINEMREQYVSFLEERATQQGLESTGTFVDKNLFNFRWAGLIAILFPEAKIIHTHRHPAAACWSLFNKLLLTDMSMFSATLEGLGRYYVAYRDLMDFWHANVGDRIFDLNYELFVEDQRRQTERLLEFCNLKFEEQCLNFHTNKQAVVTASASQVRQKLYKGASRDWEPYKEHLHPLLEIIKPYL